MKLKVLLPFRVYAEHLGVTRIVAETHEGSFGIFPNRLDCVASLVPGILVMETDADTEFYIAVDEGVLVKTGQEVLVSVRNAIGGEKLDELRGAVDREFLTLDEVEQSIRVVLARMESGFVRRFVRLHHE